MNKRAADALSWFTHALLAVLLQCFIVLILGNDKPVLWWIGAGIASALYANRERLQWRLRVANKETKLWPMDSTADLLFPIGATVCLALWASKTGFYLSFPIGLF